LTSFSKSSLKFKPVVLPYIAFCKILIQSEKGEQPLKQLQRRQQVFGYSVQAQGVLSTFRPSR
jgi:hypothetical protein